MFHYTNSELADMHYMMYGLADGNALQAKRLYEEHFSNRNVADARTFSNLHRRLCEKGSFDQDNHLKGVQDTARTPEIHMLYQSRHQEQFSVNVWAGICENVHLKETNEMSDINASPQNWGRLFWGFVPSCQK
nr:unnamed protein product [Callosobruchus chinensis]